MNHQLILLLIVVFLVQQISSFVPKSIIRSKQFSTLYNNDFARKEPVINNNDDDESTETLRKKAAEELKEREALSNSMRSRLLQEIRDGGGDPNYSKGAIAGNPILIISFVIAALAAASFAIGAI